MTDPIAHFLRCCECILANERACIEALQQQGFACEHGHWQFRLPALHAFLCGQEPALAYRDFRRLLLKSPINARLNDQGAQIVILENHGKLDASLYGLVRLPAP
ncbi:MAG TPA: hypothetical protein VJA19_13590 [Pseudomonas sp.]|nr:hypothetical protein [Pseudomonas sp.]